MTSFAVMLQVYDLTGVRRDELQTKSFAVIKRNKITYLLPHSEFSVKSKPVRFYPSNEPGILVVATSLESAKSP